VLFVCVANGGRSVLAERIFNRLAHGRHEARSAGSEPGAHVHPVVVEALTELGIDASDHVPSGLDQATIEWSDLIVSTCAEEACPVTYGRPRIRWELPDPKGRPLGEVRKTRDAIRTHVEQLLAELDADALIGEQFPISR
jgi:arsenate reductase